jgi:methenyltetrahydromethanopterin cyclohydrolase
MTSLNEHAWGQVEDAIVEKGALGITVEERSCGTRILDLGVKAPGGLAAGLAMARIGMSGLGKSFPEMATAGEIPWVWITTSSDHPLEACFLSQAAHWSVEIGVFRAMGSGPACLLNRDLGIGNAFAFTEKSDCAVLVLETAVLPDEPTCQVLAERCAVKPSKLAIVIAPTSSLAGSAQIAARSVETALHKLHQLGFDLSKVASGMGRCPVAPPTGSDLDSLGKTNDMVMFAAQVWLSVQDVPDGELAEWVQRLPSASSPSYGEPFLQILKNAGGFYAIDPGLFAPAEVTLTSLDSGRVFHSGIIDRVRLQKALGV